MTKFISPAALAVALAGPAAAQTPGQTVQQRFDAASAKLVADDAAGALAAFERLEAELVGRPKPPAQSLALVRIRKAAALARLNRLSEARAAFALGLAGNALDAAATRPLRDIAMMELGKVEESEQDHAAAAATYARLADASDTPDIKALALIGAARASMFVDAPAALGYIDRAGAVAEALPGFDKAQLAIILGTKGRILLNAGRNQEARELLERAVSLRGGMTLQVDQWDVAFRQDAALAMLRLGAKDDARRYLAYAGAARTTEPLGMPAEMPLPQCGENGLRPEDSAVIQFTIGEDGHVVGAQPVVASRQGEMAYEFARAASEWAWRPQDVEKVDGFFRAATRVQLRCTNNVDRPDVKLELDRALGEWLMATHEPFPKGAADEIERLMTEADRSGGVARRVETRVALSRLATVPAKDRLQRVEEALTLMGASDAPPAARLTLMIDRAMLRVRSDPPRGWRGWTRREAEGLQTLLVEPIVAADPRLRSIVRLELAERYGRLRQADEERAALMAVAGEAGLSDLDPLKVAALVALANVEAAAGDLDAARLAYRRTGLSAQQCALLDNGPVLQRSIGSSRDFPREAMSWGFEGWTATEYDVTAAGETTNVRTVVAYPPAVFTPASEDMFDHARYRVSYRPEGDLACGGMQQRVRFQIP